MEAAGITGEGEGVKEEEVELKIRQTNDWETLNMLPMTFSIIYFVLFIYLFILCLCYTNIKYTEAYKSTKGFSIQNACGLNLKYGFKVINIKK